MLPAIQHCRLRWRLLHRRTDERIGSTGIDRHLSAGVAAQHTRQPGPQIGRGGHRGDPKQLAASLSEEIRQADGVVDVVPDIGIDEH